MGWRYTLPPPLGGCPAKFLEPFWLVRGIQLWEFEGVGNFKLKTAGWALYPPPPLGGCPAKFLEPFWLVREYKLGILRRRKLQIKNGGGGRYTSRLRWVVARLNF